MRCIQNPDINYDAQYDILSYNVADTSNSYCDEEIDDIVVKKDFDTDQTTGYTIMYFKQICEKKGELFNIVSNLIDINKAMKYVF